MAAEWKHDITISPDRTGSGERGQWYAAVDGDYDGSGSSIEEALCDLIDVLKDAVDRAATGDARREEEG